MFGSSKPIASLSSGLLARKGHARPAMRPQGFVHMGGGGPTSLEDLGWNDMGDPPLPEPHIPPVVRQQEALREEFAPAEQAEQAEQAQRAEQASPDETGPAPVEALNVTPPAPVEPAVEIAASPARARRAGASVASVLRGAGTKRGKTAFTLRLDPDRHLRLRLASAVRGASAQALVTEALDAFLQTLPEVDELARQIVPASKR